MGYRCKIPIFLCSIYQEYVSMEKPDKQSRKLFTVKITHTIIWVFFVMTILYIPDNIGILVWIAISLIIIEGIILLVNGWRCPLTLLGQKYTDNTDTGFDIFLPKWLAKNNKTIFTTIYFIDVVIVIYRLLT